MSPILNDVAAEFNAATYAAQATPDYGDTIVWQQGHDGIGVVNGGGVTHHAAGANMSVDVAAGQDVIGGVVYTYSASLGLTITANSSGNTRVDLVVYTVGSGLQVITGTAVSSGLAWPSFNATTQVVHAIVVVPTGASSILDANLVDKRIMLPAPYYARQSSSVTTGALTSSGEAVTTITLAKSYRLLSMTQSAPCRIRLYDRTAKQTTDATRPLRVLPSGDTGLVYEFIGAASLLTSSVEPSVVASSLDPSPSTAIPITIDNLSGVAQGAGITVTFTYLALE